MSHCGVGPKQNKKTKQNKVSLSLWHKIHEWINSLFLCVTVMFDHNEKQCTHILFIATGVTLKALVAVLSPSLLTRNILVRLVTHIYSMQWEGLYEHCFLIQRITTAFTANDVDHEKTYLYIIRIAPKEPIPKSPDAK